MLVRRRSLTIILALAVITVSLFITPRAHASAFNYNSTPNTALAVDHAGDYFNGQTIGEYGSSTGFDFVAPVPTTQQSANFYVGVMANTIITSNSDKGGGVRNLHVTMSGIYPDGTRIDGLHMVADQPLEGPNGSASPDALESIVRAALGTAFGFFVPTDILSLNFYNQPTPAPYGRDSYDVFADWTCATTNCLNQLGDQYLFPYASLKDSFHLNVNPNEQGTYFLQFIYQVDFVYCSHTGLYKGATLCDGWNDLTQGYIDNILYCFVKCSSSGASFISQTPNSGSQTAQVLKPSQTTYLDSQLSTSTFNTADPIYVGTYQKTQDALIGFSLPSIPANSVITSANIQVFHSQTNPYPPPFGNLRCNGSGAQCQISVSRISASWDASTATWNNPPTTTGAQTVLRYPQPGQWTIDVTSQVQAGYATGNFYGIELSPADPTEYFQYGIQSGLSQSQFPVLTVNYITYTSPPSSMCTGQTANVAITMSNTQIVYSGNVGYVVSNSNWLPPSINATNPFVLESESPEANSNWGMNSVALNTYVLYGQSYTFSFKVTAPMVPGMYKFQWRMAQVGVGSFGDYSPLLSVNVQPCGDFSISSTSVTVPVGQSGTSTITLNSLSGFAGQVNLSDSPLPAGLTCNALNPSSVALPPSPATATLTCSSTTAGTYSVTVTGTIGSLSHSTTFTFAVDPYLTASSSPSLVASDGTSSSTITIQTSNNQLNLVISLSTSLGTLSSTSCTTGSTGACTVTLASTTAGVATVTASAPSFVGATTSVTFAKVTLAANPTLVPADFVDNSTITAQLSNSAQGVTVSFSTNVGTFTSSSGNLASCTTGSTGSCSVAVQSFQAGAATITASAPGYATGQVIVNFFDYSETLSTTSIAAHVGTSTTVTATFAPLNGFSGTINLALLIFQDPTGIFCSISPQSVTLGSSATATLTCTGQKTGSYTVTVYSSSGKLYHAPIVSYTIQDFAISSSSLAIDGSVSIGCGHNTNSCSASLTTSHSNDIIIVYTTESLDLQPSCTFSVSDQAGLAWTLRASAAGRTDYYYTTTPRDQLAEFWAKSPNPLTLDTITESISGCASTQYGGEYNGFQAFGVSGANYNNPFDPNASLPGTANNYSNTPAVTLSTSNPNDMIISIAQQSSYGTLTPGSGFISLIPGIAASEYQTDSSTVSNLSVNFGDSAIWYWEQIADAISPSASSGVIVGSSPTETVILTGVNGFTGTISLTDNVPSGLTCSAVNPTSLTLPPTPAAATLTCRSTTAGTYSVTVTATSGPLSHTVTISFSFNDFSLNAVPNAVATSAGGSITVAINENSLNGFTGTVNLSVSSTSPNCVISPSTVTLGSSASANLSCPEPVEGVYTATVTGTSGSLSHSTTVSISVYDFTISASPTSATIPVGGSTTVNVVVTTDQQWPGFSIYMPPPSCPTGVACQIGSTPPLNPGQSYTVTLTITAGSSSVAGNYVVTATGQSGFLSHSVNINLSIRDFSLTTSPTSVTFNTGSTGTSTLTLTSLNGFTGSAMITTSSPTGVTTTCSPSSVTMASGGSYTSTCTFSSSTVGTYTVTITATSGPTIHTATITANVVDFTITASTGTLTITRGSSGTSTITVTSVNGFSGTVSLSATISGAGSKGPFASFSTTSVTCSSGNPGTSVLTISTQNGTAKGTYTVTVTATNGSLTHTATITITVV